MRQLLKQRVNIVRPVYTNDDSLGVNTNTTIAYSNLPASLQPATSSVMDFYAQRQLKISHTAYVAGTPTLERGDYLTFNGVQYAIIGARDLSGWGKVTAIDLELFEA